MRILGLVVMSATGDVFASHSEISWQVVRGDAIQAAAVRVPEWQIARRGLDTVAKQEFLGAREFLDGRNQPHQELEMGLDSSSGLACVVAHGRLVLKKTDQGCALDPRSKELKTKDLTFWPRENRGR